MLFFFFNGGSGRCMFDESSEMLEGEGRGRGLNKVRKTETSEEQRKTTGLWRERERQESSGRFGAMGWERYLEDLREFV